MNQLCATSLLSLAMGLPTVSGRLVAAEEAPPSPLAFFLAGSELHFDTGLLRGSLGEAGKSLGLRPLTFVPSGVQAAGAYGILSPYRLLTSDDRFGTAAWDWARESQVLAGGAARVRWSPDRDHPLELTGVYRWSAANALDLELTVKPQRDLRRFELFLASYFNGFSTSLACAKQVGEGGRSGRFVEAVKAAGYWQMFPRDDEAAVICRDGRWNRPPNPVTWKIMPCFRAPLAVRRDAGSRLAAVLMARPSDCFAVSMPYGEEGHRSVYFSLFGVDLKAGREVSTSVRLVMDRDVSDDQAVDMYRAFLKRTASSSTAPSSKQ